MRTYVITAAASDIGSATAHLLTEQGNAVMGADLHAADINRGPRLTGGAAGARRRFVIRGDSTW